MSGIEAKNADVGSVYRTNGGKLVTVIARNHLKRVLVHVHATGTEVPVPGDYILTPAPEAASVDVSTLTKLYAVEKPSKKRATAKPTTKASRSPQESQDGSHQTTARVEQAAIESGKDQSQHQVTDRATLAQEILGLLRNGPLTCDEVYHLLVGRFPSENRSSLKSRSRVLLAALCHSGQAAKKTGEPVRYEALPESA